MSRPVRQIALARTSDGLAPGNSASAAHPRRGDAASAKRRARAPVGLGLIEVSVRSVFVNTGGRGIRDARASASLKLVTDDLITRINRPDEGRGRCKGSRASGRRKDFSQCMQQSTTPSTSNVILHRQERTEPFGPQRCRHGTKSSPRREPDVPAELLRALFGNVTKPLFVQNDIQQ